MDQGRCMDFPPWRSAATGPQQERSLRNFMLRLDGFFEVSKRGSTIATEVRAGCVTFVTMSYIMLVNSVLLYKANSEELLAFESLLTATALSSAIGSALVGLLGNAPMGMLPGLRLNAYFTFGFCQTLGIRWGEALSCCFMSGALTLLLAWLGVCDWLVRAFLSDHLKKASAAAMGIFQAMVGLQMMGYVVTERHSLTGMDCSNFTLNLSTVQCSDLGVCLALGTFCVISCLLVATRVNCAMLIGVFAIGIGSWVSGLALPPQRIFAAPRFETALTVDFSGWFASREKIGSMVLGTLVMLFVALCDIAGVKYGLYSIAGLLRHGTVPRGRGIMVGAALGTMSAGLLGTSPLVIANESSAGILDGARTGLSAVTIAVLYSLSAFISPLLTAIPDLAAAAPLVLTGAFMMDPCRSIAWNNMRIAIPSFVTIMLVPLSIHHGITAGIVLDVGLGFIARLARKASAEQTVTPERTLAGTGRHGSTPREQRPPTPHSLSFVGVGLQEAEKVERAKQLLLDLGPPCTGMRASDTWEIALRQALQTYMEGMRSQLDVGHSL